jgi:sugar lactone lactonase YvrE
LSSQIGIAVDAHGNIFIADALNNQVKEALAVNGATPANPTINVLGSGFNTPSSVAVDANGNVFVADEGNNEIKEILAVNGSIPSSNPTIKVLGNNFSSPSGVAVDTSGDVFVADTAHNEVKEILAVNGSIPSSNPTINILGSNFFDFNYPYSVSLDTKGNVYVADTGHAAVKEILKAGGYSTVNVLSTVFTSPVDAVVDGSGNVFVADGSTTNIEEILAVNGSVAPSSTPIDVPNSGFINQPHSVAVGSGGQIYAMNTLGGMSGGSTVVELMPQVAYFSPASISTGSPQTLTVTFTFNDEGETGDPQAAQVYTQGATSLDFTLAGGGGTCEEGAPSFYEEGDTCTVTVTFTPTASGPRYGSAEILDPDGNALGTLLLFGIGTGPQVTFSPGTLTPFGGSYLSQPYGVAVDAKDNLYVADTFAGQIDEFTAASGYSTGNDLSLYFYSPAGIAVDGAGNLFVSDGTTDSVSEVLAVNGSIPSNPTINTLATFTFPVGIALDQYGNVFVADAGNNAVDEIICVSAGCTVNALGSGFSSPAGVAVDASGNVFVADAGNAAVKEIVAVNGGIPANPTINTIGSGFSSPTDVSVDGNGNVYVVDGNNLVLQKILASGGYTTVQTLATGFTYPVGTALDSQGNVFVADQYAPAIDELNLSNPASLTFPSTAIGSSSTPQTVTLTNYGNAPLSFPKPSTGLNPAFPAGFTLDSTSSCPRVSPSSSAGSLAANTSCTLAIDFTPTAIGAATGSIVVTDNAFYLPAPNYATQTIALSGTGTTAVPPPSKSTPTITVTSSANPVVAGSSVTLTVKLSGTSGTPTGTVEFKDGSTVLATVNLIDGTASFTTTDLAVGTQSITVVYSGDSNFNTVTSSVLSLVVQSGGTPTGIQIGFGSTSYAQTTATGSATYSVNISPVGAFIFNDKVTYTLSGIPDGNVQPGQHRRRQP